MKILVSTACIAIILAVGYYFATEWQRWRRDSEVADIQQQRRNCLQKLDEISKGDNQTIVTNCMFKGLLSQADLDRFIQEKTQNR
ncbi:hypothetical protein [Aminobacter sp. BE322]|uniref:hypothetical protein n=1 Tax=unclassified Aminobacter TaxID=2644704 RepID=UPI003D23C49C